MYASQIKELCRFRRKKTKRALEISAPFNFKKEDTMLPGISDDEVSILREKAMASRLGVAEARQRATVPARSFGPMSYHPIAKSGSQGSDSS